MKSLYYLRQYRQKKMEIKLYGEEGDEHNGIFKVYVDGKGFWCVASNGGGWENVSVSPSSKSRKTCPTWDEMCAIKDMFFDPEEVVVQYHPRKSDYVNNHPFCLHLWKPINQDMPTPPKIYVGV